MNATIRSEKIESTEADSNLAAVSEVEAGIRDFVRNDIAYLRRPAAGLPSTTDTPPLEPSHESHRQQRQLADPTRRRHLAG